MKKKTGEIVVSGQRTYWRAGRRQQDVDTSITVKTDSDEA